MVGPALSGAATVEHSSSNIDVDELAAWVLDQARVDHPRCVDLSFRCTYDAVLWERAFWDRKP